MLVWMDLEMTGLDPGRHTIVEIATLVTDDDLTVVAEGPDLVVRATPEQLAAMDDFVRDMHTRSGLLAAIEASTMTLEEAGQATMAFLRQHLPSAGTVPLAGNSIGTDRRFLAAELPEIEKYLHYRSVDVSTHKGAGPSLVPRRGGRGAGEEDLTPGDGRHQRERGRTGLLPRRDLPTPEGEGTARAGPWWTDERDVTADADPTARLVPSRTVADADAELTAPGQLFEMDEIVIRGVVTRVWKSAPASLRTVLDLSLGHADDDFLVYEDERTTFGQHYRIAATLARRLRDRFGVAQGDRVAIAMRNLPEWVMAFWATAVAGAIVVPLNAWWTGEELEYALGDSGSVVAFVDRERAERIGPHLGSLSDLRALVVADEHRVPDPPPASTGTEIPFGEVLGTVDPGATPPEVDIDPDDDATIFYTSGTTGKPKGAVGTHRNTCTNLMNLFFVNTRQRLRHGPGGEATPARGQNSSLLSVPLFHATGCHAVMITNTAAGGKLVMMHHFDPERALELIERERITTFGGVPTMVMEVLDSPALASRDTSSVRSVSYGGAPAPPDLVRRIGEHFPVGQAGNGYGLTETSALTSMNTGADYVRKPDSVGPTVPVTDVVVVPEEYQGTEPDPSLPAGPQVRGELWVKGPQVVRGYWGRPEDTALVFTEGWLHTGDVARIDEEGFIYIVDRAKDVIIRGGENVYSVEVEGALFEHPAVADCAVIGVPDPVMGEEVGAVLVLRPGHKVAADELALHVRDRLAAYNVPTRFWLRHAPIPRNPAGKVLKRSLRDQVLAGGDPDA